jgi:3-hydroxyisobutyrate dehydrogenase-like beta-hydroxyacid dehydrogenase
MRSNTPRLCFIGFGEAGQAIASGLRDAGVEAIAVWDILLPTADGNPLRAAGAQIGARIAGSATATSSSRRSPPHQVCKPRSRWNRT